MAILWKDLLTEIRSKEIITPLVGFSVVTILIFSMLFSGSSQLSNKFASSILWIGFTFGGILGLIKIFSSEKENNGMAGMSSSSANTEQIYFGKLISTFLFLSIVELIMLPVFGILFNIQIFMLELWLITLLGTLGFSAIGTTFSAMTMNLRSKDIMLPILFLPIVIPVIIAAVSSSTEIINGGSLSEIHIWLELLVVFDALFILIGAWTFRFVTEE